MKYSKIIPNFFIVGIRNFAYSKELDSFLKEFPVSGLALFNSPFDDPLNIWKDPESAMEIVYEFVVKVTEQVSFLSADQEGGRVRRLRPPFIRLPSAEQMRESFEESKSMKEIASIYQFAAKQMAHTGIQLNFAPNCDLRTAESNKVVGDRSYGEVTEEVLPFIKTFCETFENEGVRTTLKHFPGHGPTRFDSHEQAAIVFKSKKELFKEDRSVFLKAAPQASAIMTAHIAFEDAPERILSIDAELLAEFRKGLPDHLAWITDDLLSMNAVAAQKPWLKAFDCEYDYILLCGDLDKSVQALEDTIRHAEGRIKNFEEQMRVEKKAARSTKRFSSNFKLPRFDVWKKQILEWEKIGNDHLEKAKIKF
jgi:beta-N-acetylhexosaminidase